MENEIGVIVTLRKGGGALQEARDFGLKVCQLVNWDMDLLTDEIAHQAREEARRMGVRITAFWAGYPGPCAWDFESGPSLIGLVPEDWRARRVDAIKRGADFAHRVGLPAIITHLGFIPENPKDPALAPIVSAVRDIAQHAAALGMEFWFETGQETPVALLRLMRAVGTDNLGVNLDPANLILYGKGNPIDALDVLGPYVRNVHAKDGFYPTDPMKLGREVKVGEGRVRFPEFVRRLKEIGFKGEFIIEREISGEQQRRDIAETVAYLRGLLSRV